MRPTVSYRRDRAAIGGASADDAGAQLGQLYAGVPHSDRKRAQTDIAAWTAMPGRILSVAARFPLYKTAAAHKAVEAGGKVGTVVVEPQR